MQACTATRNYCSVQQCFYCKALTHTLFHLVVCVTITVLARHYAQQSSPQEQLASTTVAVLGLLFGLFTICMLFDQFSNLETGLTKIDRLKGDVSANSSSGANRLPENLVSYGERHSVVAAVPMLQHMCSKCMYTVLALQAIVTVAATHSSAARIYLAAAVAPQWHWMCPWPATWPPAERAALFGYDRSAAAAAAALAAANGSSRSNGNSSSNGMHAPSSDHSHNGSGVSTVLGLSVQQQLRSLSPKGGKSKNGHGDSDGVELTDYL
eukprot:10033-Heterococcus_DN1.PRE.2